VRQPPSRNDRSTLPVCVLTGFLGAGKTSLLNHFLSSGHGLRIGVVVNDFGAIDIDSQLVESVTEDTVSLRNGCICCSMRDDFFDAILKLVRRESPPDVLVVETSGVSDPSSVVLTLTDPALASVLRVDSVVTVVDSESFGDLGQEEMMLAKAQINLADLVVLNKTDLVTEDHLRALETKIHELAPKARLFRTEHGRVPIAAIIGFDAPRANTEKSREPILAGILACETGEASPPGFGIRKLGGTGHASPSRHGHHRHHEPHGGCCGAHDHVHGAGPPSLTDAFESCSLSIERQLSLDAVRDALLDLPLFVYRLKGLFYVDANPDRQLLIQVVGPRISAASVKPWGDKPRCSEIVAIGLKGRIDSDALHKQFQACVAVPGIRLLQGLSEKVLFWRRNSLNPERPGGETP